MEEEGNGADAHPLTADGRSPESIEAVKAFAQEAGLPLSECEPFWDHYVANGWKQGGRAALVSWQAAFRGWCRRAGGIEKKRGGAVAPAFNPELPNAHTGGLPIFEPVAVGVAEVQP